jgi:hypothetical protein
VESSCEFDIEPSGSIKNWDAIEWPINWWSRHEHVGGVDV